MSLEHDFLSKTADRLGVQDESVLKKSKEFLRVLHNKGTIKNLNDIAKTILCLDLASLWLGSGFDKETAIKLSGLKKTAYQNHLHLIEKVLDLSKQLTVSELCVQCSCTVVKELAEEILAKYKNKDSKIKDFSHPQYVAAAVYVACKLKGIATSKTQFISVSHLKAVQWKELTLEFEKFVESLGMTSNKIRKKGADEKNVDEELPDELESEVNIKKKEADDDEIETYEVWRKRILKGAIEAVQRRNET